ncbi:alpha/beta fold hydrolase [Chitinophaga sp. sic0106]|uniref:alpha/beta fold hydrolase n=1 Tax=Chitinophaga sp. sic0106 TaxID=2854785 RepID=UPI001C446926|nr:alpha/beta hydrolase [Chitinophaga sp. sic0106]MBV7532485.1 alpha/beta hydrolase [Chitinophaga sp. sic0106]
MTPIKKISAALLLLTIVFQTATAQVAPNKIKNIVFVHGAFADGSSWAKVFPLLQAKGYNVVAVQNPLTSLTDDVAATKRAIALMDGPVLLVGHSYGGMVISAAGNDPKVVGLLYVCALVPDENQSVVDVTTPYPAPGSAEFRPDAEGFLSLSPKGIKEYFAQDLPLEERKVVYATQVPWATRATTEKVANPAWKNKPSWFIIGLEDYMVPPALAKAEAKMINAKTLELKSSHIPMVSQPKRVAEFIATASQQL